MTLASDQLARMRAMNGRYHRQFFGDVRFTTVASIALFAAGSALDPRLVTLVPLVALMGAAQTAFDASYLIFSRQYSTRLEQYLNASLDRELLIAHRMEDAYVFPLDKRKIVSIATGTGFTWFGFMTAFYTAIGAVVFLVGAAIGFVALADRTPVLAVAYAVAIASLTLATLATGWWWFVSGVGERRLRETLDTVFG